MKRSVQKVLEEKLGLRIPEGARVLTTFEVASILRVTRWTLSSWRKDRRGPPFLKLTRNIIRYPRRPFERFLRQHLQTAEQEKL